MMRKSCFEHHNIRAQFLRNVVGTEGVFPCCMPVSVGQTKSMMDWFLTKLGRRTKYFDKLYLGIYEVIRLEKQWKSETGEGATSWRATSAAHQLVAFPRVSRLLLAALSGRCWSPPGQG